ncbi:MAG: prephenate dehydratase [Thermosediminibacterales bacterium]|nr:prephenate dehydratase [Thermosediminibacterales bacterium]MDK2835658.1 prephenate dehydratase [Thermosediminibacterales bacterium]
MIKRIGYLGPSGTFCEEALEKYLNGKEHQFWSVGFNSISQIFEAVNNKQIDEGIVPIENSIEGSVNLTIDLLIHEYDLKIKNEILLYISQNLMTHYGVLKKDIKTIYSHPQAFFQCRKYIYQNYPDIVFKETSSTAEAVKLSINCKDGAVIGSKRLAEIYGLKIIAKDIQENKQNLTRFVVISHEDSEKTGHDKTSLIFSVKNSPGSLYKILGEFASRNLNLTKIESRPSKKCYGEYMFVLEVEGHRKDKNVIEVLKCVREKTSFFKLLGSYPKYKTTKGDDYNGNSDEKYCYAK